MQLIELIEKASSIAGSDYKLAQQLGVSRVQISQWRHGVQTCPPEQQALMANLVGADAREQLIEATLAKHAGTEKGARLAAALKQAGAALAGLLAVIPALGVIAAVAFERATMYIM